MINEVSGKLDVECVQKWQASAKRTPAYLSNRESLMASSSRNLEVSGKHDAVFSFESELSQNTFSGRDRSNELWNRFESSVRSVYRFADPANIGKSLHDGNKDHCLIKQGLNLWSRNIMSDLLTIVSKRFSNKIMLKDWNWRTPITEIQSRREQLRVQEKEEALQGSQIRNMHEMREMKRAQELRVDEVLVKKLTENHETTQRLTSQMREMPEQMNPTNDSVEFQEVNWHHCGRLSYVPSQPAAIPSSRSMLSRDKRLRLDHRKTLVVNIFLQLIHPEINIKEFIILCFPVHELFWFSLFQVPTTQFRSFPCFSWHVWAMEQMCQFPTDNAYAVSHQTSCRPTVSSFSVWECRHRWRRSLPWGWRPWGYEVIGAGSLIQRSRRARRNRVMPVKQACSDTIEESISSTVEVASQRKRARVCKWSPPSSTTHHVQHFLSPQQHHFPFRQQHLSPHNLSQMWHRLLVCSQQRLEANKTSFSNELIRLVRHPCWTPENSVGTQGLESERRRTQFLSHTPETGRAQRGWRFIKFFLHTLHYSLIRTFLDRVFGIRLWTLGRDHLLVRTRTPIAPGRPTCSAFSRVSTCLFWKMIPMNFLFNVTLCYDISCTRAMLFSVLFCWHLYIVATASSCDGLGLSLEALLGSHWWHLQKSLLWRLAVFKGWAKLFPVEDATQSFLVAADSTKVRRSDNKDGTFKHEQPLDASSAPRSSWQAIGEPDAPTWKLSGTHDTPAFWENSEAPLPHPKRMCNFIHPKQPCPFPERWKLPYPEEEILSGYEEDVSFIRDGFTTWVKADFNTILERHVVNIRKALADYREACVRRHDTSAQ